MLVAQTAERQAAQVVAYVLGQPNGLAPKSCCLYIHCHPIEIPNLTASR